MELIKQVCSLESAKRLKELGVKQKSLFWWSEYHNGQQILWEDEKKQQEPERFNLDWYSAFTVAELGEMLPEDCASGKATLGKDCGFGNFTCIKFLERKNVFAETEAEARAKMLIYLLENKLIKI